MPTFLLLLLVEGEGGAGDTGLDCGEGGMEKGDGGAFIGRLVTGVKGEGGPITKGEGGPII